MPASASELALLTNSQMYEADRLAIIAGCSGVDLMARAGRATAEALMARFAQTPVLVLCGPGNNGGDGFVAARWLRDAGWSAEVALLGTIAGLAGDAAHHAGLWAGELHQLGPRLLEAPRENPFGLIVDALFGAGLSRALEGPARETIVAVRASGLPVIAVDVPSGISGDSGAQFGEVVAPSALTVTFFRKKPGHLLLPGRALCGETVVADIGTPDGVLQAIGSSLYENGPALWLANFPRRRAASHKYDFGKALISAGPFLTGAAQLAAHAALRVGAGLVTVACTPETQMIFATTLPSVMPAPLSDEAALDELLSDVRTNAVLIGPGSGLTSTTRARCLASLRAGKAVVVDADALSIFAGAPEELLNAVTATSVLTPHEGEFKRLFPDLLGDKLDRARKAAARCGCVILLKGADTVIAAPDGRALINGNAPEELATAGSGDVLSGLIVGLLAQGMPAFDATAAAAWLHGETATALGPGLISSDLAPALPRVLQKLIEVI